MANENRSIKVAAESSGVRLTGETTTSVGHVGARVRKNVSTALEHAVERGKLRPFEALEAADYFGVDLAPWVRRQHDHYSRTLPGTTPRLKEAFQQTVNYDDSVWACPCGESFVNGQGTIVEELREFVDRHREHANGKLVVTISDDGARAFVTKPAPETKDLPTW